MSDEDLMINVEARITELEKGMKKAQAIANKAYAGMKRDSGSATAAMERDMVRSTSRINQALAGISGGIGAFGKGLAGGFVAALAPMALFQSALNAIEEASRLVDTADRIGITTDLLQQLEFGFSQAGVAAGEFEVGMMQFVKRIGEAATKGGRLADILKANGVALRDSNGQIRSSEDLLKDYADLVKNAASEQEKMVLVTEAFGRGGGAFVLALDNGAKGIRDMKTAAEEAGGVIDEKLLRRAEEMGDRWEAGWRNFKTKGLSAILAVLEGMDSLDARMENFLRNRNAVEAGAMFGRMAGDRGDGKGDRVTGPQARINAAFLGEVVKADEALVEQLRKRYGEAAGKATIIPGEDPKTGGGKKKTEDTFKASRDGFAQMIGATEEWQEQQKLSNQLMEDFGDLAISAGNSLATALSDGKLEGQELISILQQVVSELIRMAQSAGGFGNLFSSLLGGGGFNPTASGFGDMLGMPRFAKGGVANSPSVFAEAGPEAAVPLPDGRRIPVDLRGSGSQTVHAPVNVTIDARGADSAGLARVEAQVAKLKAELPANIVKSVREANKRNVKFS